MDKYELIDKLQKSGHFEDNIVLRTGRIGLVFKDVEVDAVGLETIQGIITDHNYWLASCGGAVQIIIDTSQRRYSTVRKRHL